MLYSDRHHIAGVFEGSFSFPTRHEIPTHTKHLVNIAGYAAANTIDYYHPNGFTMDPFEQSFGYAIRSTVFSISLLLQRGLLNKKTKRYSRSESSEDIIKAVWAHGAGNTRLPATKKKIIEDALAAEIEHHVVCAEVQLQKLADEYNAKTHKQAALLLNLNSEPFLETRVSESTHEGFADISSEGFSVTNDVTVRLPCTGRAFYHTNANGEGRVMEALQVIMNTAKDYEDFRKKAGKIGLLRTNMWVQYRDLRALRSEVATAYRSRVAWDTLQHLRDSTRTALAKNGNPFFEKFHLDGLDGDTLTRRFDMEDA